MDVPPNAPNDGYNFVSMALLESSENMDAASSRYDRIGIFHAPLVTFRLLNPADVTHVPFFLRLSNDFKSIKIFSTIYYRRRTEDVCPMHVPKDEPMVWRTIGNVWGVVASFYPDWYLFKHCLILV